MITIKEPQREEEDGKLSLPEKEEDDDDESLPELEEEETLPDLSSTGVGFTGGPVWHYPEEEIEFFSTDEDVDNNYDWEYLSDYGLGDYRDEKSDGDRLGCPNSTSTDTSTGYEYSVSFSIGARDEPKPEEKPIIKLKQKMSARDDRTNTQKQIRRSSDQAGENRNHVAHVCNTKSSNKSNRRVMDRNRIKLRLRERGSSGKGHANSSLKGQEQQFDRFREAALRVPFEYTSNLTTVCVRRPYGIAAPEIFRVLAPDITDDDYSKTAHASSSQTIQVAITIVADNSLMLLHGAGGVRYKKDPNDPDWTDVPDVGALHDPLGYVNRHCRSNPGGNDNRGALEYSLDEVVEEAMLVREQYCTSLLTAALNPQPNRSLEMTPTKASPPSLAKSVVSTPSRSNFYYDGSNSRSVQKYNDEEEDPPVRKRLDFLECLSPSVMSNTRTIETSRTSQLGGKSLEEKLRRKKRRKAYRFCQKVFIVVGFYCSGIFLVASLSGVDNERLVKIISVVFPSSYHDNLIDSWFLIDTTAEEHPQDTEGTNTESSTESNQLSKRGFQIVDFFSPNGNKNHAENGCSQSLALAVDESNIFKVKLEQAEQSLEEELRQNKALSEKYQLEQEHSETLLREKETAIALVQKVSHQAETLAMDLEHEQEHRRELEEKIMLLEKDIVDLRERDRVHHKILAAVPSPSTVSNAVQVRVTNESVEHHVEQDASHHYLRGNERQPEEFDYGITNITTEMPNENSPLLRNDALLKIALANNVDAHKFEKVEIFASSVKQAVGGRAKKIFKRKRTEAHSENGDSNDEPDGDRPARKRGALASIAESIRKATIRSTESLIQPLSSPILQSMQPKLVESGTDRSARTREALANIAESIRQATMRSIEVPASPMHRQYMQPKLVEAIPFARTREALASIAESLRQATIRSTVRSTENYIEAPASPILQSMKPRLVQNTKDMKKKIKASTGKALKQSKEGTKIVGKQVTTKVEVAAIAGIAKLDRGQEAIQALGDFAKNQLETARDRVARFASKKWGKRKLHGSQQGLRDLSTSHFFKGFVGSRGALLDS